MVMVGLKLWSRPLLHCIHNSCHLFHTSIVAVKRLQLAENAGCLMDETKKPPVMGRLLLVVAAGLN